MWISRRVICVHPQEVVKPRGAESILELGVGALVLSEHDPATRRTNEPNAPCSRR
jgi:hypothetical protein